MSIEAAPGPDRAAAPAAGRCQAGLVPAACAGGVRPLIRSAPFHTKAAVAVSGWPMMLTWVMSPLPLLTFILAAALRSW